MSMDYKKFEMVISVLERDEETEKMLRECGVSIFEAQEPLTGAVFLLLELVYGKDGRDWIEWWLWEDVKKVVEITKEKGVALKKSKKVQLKTKKQLWEFLKEYEN